MRLWKDFLCLWTKYLFCHIWFVGSGTCTQYNVPPGGPLKYQGGYQAHPKIHVIRVVFQNQAMYARTSFRGAKTCKIGKKGCVFGHIDKFWKGHDRQIKKNACKNAYLGSIFIPEKYVIRVLFVSPWTSLIPPLAIRVAPRECTRDTWWYYLEIPLISSSRTGDSF